MFFFHSRCFNRCSVRRIQAWRSLACSTPASKAQNLEAAINRPWWFWGMVYFWVYHIYDSYKDIWSIYRSLMIFVHLDFTASQYISMSVGLYHARKKALNYTMIIISGHYGPVHLLQVLLSMSRTVCNQFFKHFPASASVAKGLWLWLWLNLGHARAPKGSIGIPKFEFQMVVQCRPHSSIFKTCPCTFLHKCHMITAKSLREIIIWVSLLWPYQTPSLF